MKLKGFFIVICIQIGVVIFLTFYIYKLSHSNRIVVSPIKHEFIQEHPSGSLSYFYEPTANTIEKVQREWLSYSPTYHINSDSLNERYEYEIPKPNDTFRIVTLGDSFTFGAYVNTQDNWTELLEDYLNKYNMCSSVKKYEVINTGVDGYDLAYETERYIGRGKKYNPDIVIMLITDFGRVTEHRRMKNATMPTLSNKQKEDYKKQGNYYPEMNIYDVELSHIERVEYQMKSVDRLMTYNSKPMLVVDFSIDNSYELDIQSLPNRYSSIRVEQMKLKRNNKRYILADWHPNIEGHKKITEEMLFFLKNNKLLPCT